MSHPLTEEDLETLRQLHADGFGRNEIARQLGCSPATVTNWAQRLDLSFDRTSTRAAVDARQIDLKDQRQQAQQRLMNFFNEQLDRVESRYLLTGFKATGEVAAQWLDLPPAKETKDLTTAAMQALNGALKLAQVDAGDAGRENARGLLQSLSDAMATAARELGGDDADEYGS
ncbi:helix-turn-helix domain-containing protein [Streptomyces sp. NPDC057438]|uniref:helix-turn-helix domain-containing protein n=1 Tax=Streptomyces sp. NPDC057438 TaxID=3346133 RepID=UPI0036BF18E3